MIYKLLATDLVKWLSKSQLHQKSNYWEEKSKPTTIQKMIGLYAWKTTKKKQENFIR